MAEERSTWAGSSRAGRGMRQSKEEGRRDGSGDHGEGREGGWRGATWWRGGRRGGARMRSGTAGASRGCRPARGRSVPRGVGEGGGGAGKQQGADEDEREGGGEVERRGRGAGGGGRWRWCATVGEHGRREGAGWRGRRRRVRKEIRGKRFKEKGERKRKGGGI